MLISIWINSHFCVIVVTKHLLKARQGLGALENTKSREVSGKVRKPRAMVGMVLGNKKSRCGPQVPFRINMAVCPQSEPVLHCLFHSSLSRGILKTGKIIQCARLGDRAWCSVSRLGSVYCRHHFILKTEPCLFLWGIFYIIRMSLFFLCCTGVPCLDNRRFFVLEMYI